MRAKTLANLEVDGNASAKPGKKDAGVMGFLRTFYLDSYVALDWHPAQQNGEPLRPTPHKWLGHTMKKVVSGGPTRAMASPRPVPALRIQSR
jgi:hypothetical protein